MTLQAARRQCYGNCRLDLGHMSLIILGQRIHYPNPGQMTTVAVDDKGVARRFVESIEVLAINGNRARSWRDSTAYENRLRVSRRNPDWMNPAYPEISINMISARDSRKDAIMMCITGLVIISIVVLLVVAARRDHHRREVFAKEHKCQVVERRKAMSIQGSHPSSARTAA
jgi:hypothetical protein